MLSGVGGQRVRSLNPLRRPGWKAAEREGSLQDRPAIAFQICVDGDSWEVDDTRYLHFYVLILWGWKDVYILQTCSCSLDGKKVSYHVFHSSFKVLIIHAIKYILQSYYRKYEEIV